LIVEFMAFSLLVPLVEWTLELFQQFLVIRNCKSLFGNRKSQEE